MLDTTIQVKTDQFDGPLGLLLMLVQKEEMSIRQLDLNQITKQYLSYLAGMKEVNFDVAGDYLFLASTLLYLKSQSCVSEDEQKEIPEEVTALGIANQGELIRRLEELQKFQWLSQKLWALPKLNHEIFVRPKINRKAIIDTILTPIELDKLTAVMMDLMFREKRKYTVVKRDRLSIKEKLVFLKDFLRPGTPADFAQIIERDGEWVVENVVITFISLLELARLKKISLFQSEDGKNIYIEVVESLMDFDIDSATGFDPLEAEGQSDSGPQLQ